VVPQTQAHRAISRVFFYMRLQFFESQCHQE
jgi:hypothetical protein